jgi:hypothetical protein
MNEFNDLTSRLKAMGESPVPPPVATEHLTAMAAVAAPRTRFSHKLRVAAAFGVGIFVGGTGLGYAAAHDALPTQAQDAVEAAGRVVGLEIAKGKSEGKAGGQGGGSGNSQLEEVACEDAENHGQYVRSIARKNKDLASDADRDAIMKEAAESDCGKPDGSGGDDVTEDLDDEGGAPDGKGKPEGVGGGKPETTGPDAAGENAPELEEEGTDLDAEGDEEEEVDPEGDAEGAPGGGRPDQLPGNAPAETPTP